MSVGAVQAFPTVVVTMQPDGSAHLNVTGTHIDYEPAAADETRAAVIRDVAQIAAHLKRPVRMQTTDPTGTWLVAVAPDGHVTELVTVDTRPPKRKAKTPAKPTPPPPAAALPLRDPQPQWPARSQWAPPVAEKPRTQSPRAVKPAPGVTPAPVEPAAASAIADDVDDKTQFVKREPKRSALLTFSNRQTVVVSGRALVGRKPVAAEGETFDQVLSIADPGRTISKTHFQLEWRENALWISDRGSANGVRVDHSAGDHVMLAPLEPHQLEHGDVVNLGTETFTVLLEQS